jgi:lipoate---protein ligase
MIACQQFDHDDDLIDSTRSDFSPRVRVYGWQGTAVVIGRGGKQELELNQTAVSEDLARGELSFYKRRGGGCSVVLDPGNLIVSVVLPVPGIGHITSSFTSISNWLIRALDTLGVSSVTQEGISDLVINNNKIGGSCVYRTRNILYYSTTLLVDPDLEAVDRYLCHPPREPDYRQKRNHRAFMGSLHDLGLVTDIDAFRQDLEFSLNSSLAGLCHETGCGD